MANRPALIREADLARIFRAAKKAGVEVQVDIAPDQVRVTTGRTAKAANSNGLDEMFG